ncbi:MAG TPA: M23 family metallopeptidase [Stellaceae bacterium]|nr:M23 family metallopeptidase [Stellaceae bacterium]
MAWLFLVAAIGGAWAKEEAKHATVQKGDTLYAISRRFEVPVRLLIDANHLRPPFALAPGRSLILPKARFHRVAADETLYGISQKYGVDASTLAKLNGIGPPYTLSKGQSLALPAPVQVVRGAAPMTFLPAKKPTRLAAPVIPAVKPVHPKPAPAPVKVETPPLPPPVPDNPPPARRDGFVWPVHGKLIAGFGPGPGGTHNDGVNIAARAGARVYSAEPGVVAYAGNELRGYGNLILVKHPKGYMTAYAHNASLLVKRGDRVKQGQAIALVGSTGAVGEPQLHFEIRHGTRALDPEDYLPQ